MKNNSNFHSSAKLPVMEQFYSLQGEGFHSGRAAYFIRLAGCDVGCVWCDVKESWDADIHPILSISEIIEPIKKLDCKFVVITGGEPAMYDLTLLTRELQALGAIVALETSGCHSLKGDVDWYCFSPKKFKNPIPEAYILASELKVVISHPSDFEWAEMHASQVKEDCKLFLQTEWGKQARFLPEIIEYVKKNPKWRISLQTHKFMQIP